MVSSLLIAVEDYPDLKGGMSLYYVHSRNIRYIKEGISVTVLNFSTVEDYTIDSIKVICEKTFRKNIMNEKYSILLLHAPNIKNHYRFLREYGENFPKYVFFFHGHEVLRCSKVYSRPYQYVNRNRVVEWIRDIYDLIKLKLWYRIFHKCYLKSEFVFVSYWMYKEFVRWVKLERSYLKGRTHIIYNCIGKEFEKKTYDYTASKCYDFLSIRSNFDGSKYGVDIICNIAEEHPELKFCLIGKGKYFEYNKKPENLDVIFKFLAHDEMIKYLNMAKCALMPTRTDAQGVMACEIATFGMPMITSDIPVCKEVFENFDNVRFISNDKKNNKIEEKYEDIIKNQQYLKNEKYFEKNTTAKEIMLFNKIGVQ